MTHDQTDSADSAALRQALDRVDEPLYIVRDGEIDFVNRQLLELTGYERDELIGEVPTKLHHDEDLEERRRRLELLREDPDRTSVRWVCRLVSKRGAELPIQLEQSLVEQTAQAEEFVCRVQDIRQKAQQEQKLNILTRALRHNIRNQMNLVVGHATTLQEIDDPSYRTAAETIEAVGEQVINLANKARKAQEHLDIPAEEECQVDLVETAALVVQKFEIKHPRATVTTAFPERAVAFAPPSVEVALMELMENAAIHHESGAGPVRVVIEQDSETTAIHVDDECPPIPEAVIDTIERGEEQALRHNDGLGLWIARWIADTVNGDLRFGRREDGAGNRVRLRFKRLKSTNSEL